MNYGVVLAMAAALGMSAPRRTLRVRYDDPKEQERREEEDRQRDAKRAARATYHERLMEKQRAEIARIEKMRAEDAARAATDAAFPEGLTK